MRMFLWNWTNAEEVKLYGVKPHFQQVGPYTYREERLKMDIVWHENHTVTFKPNRTWYWEEELSGGKQTDLITVPHLPSIVSMLRDIFQRRKFSSNCFISNHLRLQQMSCETLRVS